MTQLALKATDEEVRMVETLKRYMRQNTASGVLRALVVDAYEKIFATKVLTNTTPFPSAPSAPIARPVPKDGACNED